MCAVSFLFTINNCILRGHKYCCCPMSKTFIQCKIYAMYQRAGLPTYQLFVTETGGHVASSPHCPSGWYVLWQTAVPPGIQLSTPRLL